jgi:hypothetical protein
MVTGDSQVSSGNYCILCFEGEYTIEEHLAVLMVEIWR